MGTLHWKFYSCLRLRFPDVEKNYGVLLRLAAQYSAVICGVCPGTLATWPWLRLSMILLCSETLVSDLGHVSELLVPGFGHPLLLCRGKLPRARGMTAYVRDGYGAFRQPRDCVGCDQLVVSPTHARAEMGKITLKCNWLHYQLHAKYCNWITLLITV